MFRIALLCFLFFLCFASNYAEWRQLPGPANANATKIAASETHLFAINWSGLYVRGIDEVRWQRSVYSQNGEERAIDLHYHKGSLYIIAHHSIYQSDDNLASYREIDKPIDDSGFFDGHSNENFLATMAKKGIYASQDKGASWIKIQPPPGYNPGGSFGRFPQCAITESYVLVNAGVNTILRTKDQGVTWESVPLAISVEVLSDAFALRNDEVYFASQLGIAYSSDQGSNWTVLPAELPEGVIPTAICLKDDALVVANGTTKGVCELREGSSEWRVLTQKGLPSANVWDILVPPAHPDRLVASLFQSGIFELAEDDTWHGQSDGIAPSTAILSLLCEEETMFAATADYGLHRSSDGGQSWTNLVSSVPIKPILALQRQGDMVYAGGINGLFVSSDNGDSWQQVTSGLPEDLIVEAIAAAGDVLLVGSRKHGMYCRSSKSAAWRLCDDKVLADGAVTAISASDNALWVSNNSRELYRSVDNGLSWQALDSFESEGAINGISVRAQTILVSSRSGLYLSRDEGSNWENVSGELSSFASGGRYEFRSVLALPNLLMASLRRDGVFASTDNGQTWERVHDGLPTNSTVTSLTACDGLVYAGFREAGTRGIWQRSLSEIMTDVVSVPEKGAMPPAVLLAPNPARDECTLQIDMPTDSYIDLDLVGITAQRIVKLGRRFLASGRQSIRLSTAGLANGMYYCRIRSSGATQTIALKIKR